MFGYAAMPSRIYSYGAKAPVLGLDVVDDQMHLAHRYRNELVRLELDRRARTDEALAGLFPHLRQVEAQIKEVEEALEITRQSIRLESKDARKKVVDAEAKVAAKAAKDRLKILRARRKEMRSALFLSEAWKKSRDEIQEWATAEQKRLRALSGLYWGTYLHIEQSMMSARSGSPPVFRRWDGGGHLAVQIIKGMSVSEAYGEDTRVRVVHTDERRASIYLRVGSNDDRSPVWAVVPVKMHRQLPPQARIKWIHLVRRTIGAKHKWMVQFVISAEEDVFRKKDQVDDGVVGIDLGWRVVRDGLRVACWSGSDGETGELVLPKDWMQQMHRVRDIRSVRDKNTDAIREQVVAWVAAHGLLAELLEKAPNLSLWRASRRFAYLALQWRDHRIPGDEAIYAVLEEWRKRDRHLLEFEANLRDQLQNRRLDLYRNFAAQMRRLYHVAVMKASDLRKFHVLPKDEEPSANGALREHVRDACLSVLVRCIEESMAKVVKVDGADTTSTCSWCRDAGIDTVCSWDRSDVEHVCDVCGTTWDQDINAARNLCSSVDLVAASAEVA